MSQHSFNKVGIDIMGSGIRGGNIHSDNGLAGHGVSSKDNNAYSNGHGTGMDYKKKFVNERQPTYEKISYKQNLSHPNTATSTILNTEKDPIQMIIGKPVQPQANNQSQMSPVASNQALEQYYSNAKSNQNQLNNNSNEQQQQLPAHLSSTTQQYQSNRSVAAKAGQMHIFNSQQISLTNKAKKFVSPPMSYYGKFQNQQQEPVEFQPMKMKGGATIQSGQIQNPKYVDYINRIQQQEFSAKPPLGSNYKSKEDHTQIEDQEMLQSDSIQSQITPSQQLEGVSMFKQNQTLNNSQNKNGGALQKNQMPILNVSGEQMHIEEKSLTRKTMIAGGGFDNGQQRGTVGSNSLSIKRIDLQVNAVGIAKQSKVNDENKAQIGGNNVGHRIYDYVFVQMSQDKFDKEFSNKITLTKDGNSSIAKAFTDKRYSNNATVAKKPTHISVQHSGQMAVRYKGIRTSQDQVIRNSNDTFFSPQNQTSGSLLIDDITQSLGQESMKGLQENQYQSDKMLKYSLMATHIDHIKIIGSNKFPQIIENLNEEEQTTFAEYMKDIINKISEKGRKFKITVKKKYIQDGLTTPPSQRISSVYVIVITSSPSLYFANTSSYEQNKNPLQLNQTIKTYSSSSSSSLSDYIKNYNYKENGGFNNINDKNTKGLPYIQNKESSQTRSGVNVSSIKQMQVQKVRNNSTIQASNKAGYESENETTKSMNSTTTSSTVPFFPTRNFDNNNNGTKIGTNAKNSARSLSQKGNSHPSVVQANPARKGYQKVEDSQFSSTQLLANKGEVAVQGSKYPPTKIKIVQQNDYAHLENHRINKALVMYNQFIQLAFRTKGKINMVAIINLAKQMGIKLALNAFSENGIKSREQGNLMKEKLIFYITKIINEENLPEGFVSHDGNTDEFQGISHPQQLYKCFVGKGNNSILIRTLFKTRFWWLLHDKEEIEKVNFMWTQLRKNAIMDTFSCKFQDKKSNIRITSTNSNEIHTPTIGSGKNMKKKKAQLLQQSTLSLENSSEKKDSQQFSKVAQQQIEQQQQQQQQQQLVAAQLNVKLYNKLEDNFHLSNKKALFINMRNYYEAMNKDVFSAVPVTFHVKEGLEDPEFIKFKAHYNKEEEDIKKQKSLKQSQSVQDNDEQKAIVIGQPKKNIWILKPGENTNRGNGIMVAKDFDEIKKIIEESTASRKRTTIIQKYIHNPLLINKRKFDIRAYGFFTSVNGNLKGYFYQEGYLRTSSKEFTLNNLGNRMIHLTNDAVQKKSDDYGKFEAGNKLSYVDFQNFFDKIHPDLNICFERDLLPQMKKLATDTFRAVYNKIDPKRRINTFEIYGYDFMFDDEFKVYLIEVNTNPCLELGCPLLARLIPNMVENALRLTVDPLFPPPENFSQKKCIVNDICPENKYELVFDERVDGPFLTELMKEKNNIISISQYQSSNMNIVEIDEEELSDCDEREDGDN